MDILKSVSGMVQVSLTSADIPGTFAALAEHGIIFYDTKQRSELTTEFIIHRKDYRRLQRLCQGRGERVMLQKRRGLYWAAKRMLGRPFLLMGVLLFLLAALYLPTRVFFIQVEGNLTIPTRRILEAAEECGIHFGASRREVRSERMKNALLDAVPELQWAGVNTYGCVAVISVRERSEPEIRKETSQFGNIVAIRDGVITECTAVSGNLVCSVGQAVTEGQTLISGYTDCGICIRAEQAAGEIYAQTRRDLRSVMPSQRIVRQRSGEEKKKISLLIGKKRINLWKDSGIWDTTCDRMYEEYYVTLPGGFCLPIAMVVETYTQWETELTEVTAEITEDILTRFGETYLHSQMVAGQIRSSEIECDTEDGCIRLTGEYVCIEMIGKMQREWIGENNGEDR